MIGIDLPLNRYSSQSPINPRRCRTVFRNELVLGLFAFETQEDLPDKLRILGKRCEISPFDNKSAYELEAIIYRLRTVVAL